MLQIVTKMYFREGVPLHSTVHREVLYTNCTRMRASVVDLPVGELAPSTGAQPVSTFTLSVTEHLEAEDPDGNRSVLVATSGTELVDQLADVLSFGLNAVFSRDGDLVRRLVPASLDPSNRSPASKLFRNTFDPHKYVDDGELDEFRGFLTDLLALKRSHFEAAMRAIRRIVRATQLAVDDPTVAYVDLVAALESLSDGTSAPAPRWDRMEGRKRKLIDEALTGADPEVAEGVREAVMEAERLGAKNKFVAFVIDHVSPDFFRGEATGTVMPVRGPDFERALKLAYDIRSRNVHVLEGLPPEAWVLGERADTVSPPGKGTMLGLEGLARLARHVIRNYVDRAPAEVDPTFNWRASLPGQLQVRLAPQYWIWQGEAFDHKLVDRYFSGFVANLADTFAGRNEGVTDIRPVLERIEELVPGLADGEAKALMVAIYALWHSKLAPNGHQPDASSFLAKHGHLLQRLELPAYVVGLLTNQIPDWTVDEWQTLATGRRAQREKRRHLKLPAGFDAALQVMAAERLMQAGRPDEGQTLAGYAVEELPGNEALMDWEIRLVAGQPPELDLRAIVLALEVDAAREDDTPPGSDADSGDPSAAESAAADEDAAADGQAADGEESAGSETSI